MTAGRIGAYAFAALVLGAFFAGASTLFVRLSDLGPTSSAFHRAFLALPALWLLLRWRMPHTGSVAQSLPPGRGERWALILAGVFFAGDLFFWHLSIVNTTVANATLLATMAPIYVTLGVFLLYGEKPSLRFLAGMALAIVGAGFLIGENIAFQPQRLMGDIYGVITGLFFASYILAVSRVRARVTTLSVMFWSSLVTAVVLLPLALATEDAILSATLEGWIVLVTLALVSHVGGQGLIAYALAHLPTAFSSVTMILEVVSAALLGWLFLAEPLGFWQWVGAVIVIAGIVTARRA